MGFWDKILKPTKKAWGFKKDIWEKELEIGKDILEWVGEGAEKTWEAGKIVPEALMGRRGRRSGQVATMGAQTGSIAAQSMAPLLLMLAAQQAAPASAATASRLGASIGIPPSLTQPLLQMGSSLSTLPFIMGNIPMGTGTSQLMQLLQAIQGGQK